jgi:lysine 2,3-aminomutase
MTHFNHPLELSERARAACRRFVDAGFPVMNQTVLLKGINDTVVTLSALFKALVRERVRPYYLLQMDPVNGTSHLRTTVAQGERLMQELQGKISGIALPKYIVDTPGGYGKVPAGPSFVESRAENVTRYRSPRGVVVEYWDP